jgi:hypothetical protein
MYRILLVSSLTLALFACKKPPDSRSGAASGAFPDFDLATTAKKLQGTWVFKGNMDKPTVWSIAGDKVTTTTGGAAADEVAALTIVAPCEAKATITKGSGSESMTFGFAIDGDTVYMGLGASGVKQGDVIAVCMDSDVYVLKAGKCQKGTEDMFHEGTWKWEPAPDCKLEGTTFSANGTTLELIGNALVSDQMKGNKAEKVADLAAGKAKLK